MFRISLLAALLAPLPALADPHEDLLRAAHAGDDDAVEAMIRRADTTDQQRAMMGWFAASHPETRRFVENWVEAEPDNPLALTAKSWSLLDAAGLERGDRGARDTWPASLAAARELYEEAFALADAAVTLEPDFLPASDAFLNAAQLTGRHERLLAEAERIMTLRPNRGSLIAATSSLAPQWGGSLEAVVDLCTRYADKLPDTPQYTVELCLIEAALEGRFPGEAMLWANEKLLVHFDNPLMETRLMEQARDGTISMEALNRLRERLIAEDRLTVDVGLFRRMHIAGIRNAPLLEAIKVAVRRELVEAIKDADRRPASPSAVGRLAMLYGTDIQVKRNEIGYYQIDKPLDFDARHEPILAEKAAYDADLERRLLTLLAGSPRNVRALQLAGSHLTDHLPDPLGAAEWNLALWINAAVYSNHRYFELDAYLSRAMHDRDRLQERIRQGDAPAYSEWRLDEVFTCPYIRAVRLLAEACQRVGLDPQTCSASFESLGGLDLGSKAVFDDAAARGACIIERYAPLSVIRFREIDLGL